QKVDCLPQYGGCKGITGCLSLTDHLTSDLFDVASSQIQQAGMQSRLRGESSASSASNRWSRRQRFDAARLSATTTRTAVVDSHVAAFCRGAGASVVDASIENDTGTDSRADGGVENIVVPATCAP